MKSSKNFQKSKKTRHFEHEAETKVKKVGSSKKTKYFKREIEEELDEPEELDLFGFNDNESEEDED